MNDEQRAALRAIADHYENEGPIPTEHEVAQWLDVRLSHAVEVIDWLARAGYIKLMDASLAERAVDSVTHKGNDYLAATAH